MTVGFLGPATVELTAVIDFYNIQSEDLGYLLTAKVAPVARIIRYPKAWKHTPRKIIFRVFQRNSEISISIH